MIIRVIAVVIAIIAVILIVADYFDVRVYIDLEGDDISDPHLLSNKIDAISEQIAYHEDQIQTLSEGLVNLIEEQRELLQEESSNE